MNDSIEYRSMKDIKTFIERNPEMKSYKEMLIDFHKTSNFNPFFSKLKKNYRLNKQDTSILNELRAAYNLKNVCGFHVVFMPEKDFGSDLKKLKQGSYMIFQMPQNTPTKDLSRIKSPDFIAFFRGEPFHIEIKTINNSLKNSHKIIQKINESVSQIETFGQGLIQIFCENISDVLINNFNQFESEILNHIENNANIMGVLLTFYNLISDEQISENQSKKVYKKGTKYLANKNFKKILVRNQQ